MQQKIILCVAIMKYNPGNLLKVNERYKLIEVIYAN